MRWSPSSGGELLGLTHYLFHRSTTMIEPNCYLQDLFTARARARQRRRPRLDQRACTEQAQACRMLPGLLADPRDQPHRDAALRQGGGAFRFRRLPQAVLDTVS